jgi:hypothetical protein
MALQLSTTVRTARVAAIETAVGGTALMKLLTGSMPANPAAADTGSTVCSFALPADYLDTPTGGTVGKNGTWQETSADGSGTVGYFRIYNNTGATCHMQGTCTNTSGGGDLELQNVIINAGQQVTISSFVLTDGNA